VKYKLFARALYDNTAETEDELAFRKGDIVMVLEKNVAGSIGWWKCSLLGRQGLAPANRLAPLSPAEAEKISMTLGTEKDYLNQNIYQTPKATRQPEIPIYEEMSTIYKVPLQAVPAPDKLTFYIFQASTARRGIEIYDVPRLVRKTSLFTVSPLVATIPPLASQDPNYDIPVPSISDDIQKPLCLYSTMPKPRKSEWIYDVPVFPQKKESDPCYYGTMPPKTMYSNKPLYDTLPKDGWQPVEGTIRRDDKDHQRSSTVSTSSTASSSSRSSCDSFINRLLELQEAVCQSVPKLMLFVSSHWRTKEHLSQHLHQIRMATEDVTDSVTCFLNFALDVRGNAQRLTDFNLQTRLLKQLSIVEDSGLILQEAARTLRDLGWPLDTLAQDADQSQTPDHLERFVMVARTIPEDVKRLVSILNANGKLLFKVPAKEPDVVEKIGTSERSKSEPMVDSGIDESDYVQLQVGKSHLKQRQTVLNQREMVSKSQSVNPCTPVQTSRKPSISDHCRLYFGAIQKAISVFICSLNNGQPPEKFISHSKLVIMVGQRLVNTLCSEAKNNEGSQEMLSVSNKLCAHLKQLAIMTKKAALNFPDKLALQEVQDIAKDLAQRAQQYRLSLDI
uniref:Cas scaffold protein family member 4 n=1 Tax=Cyprinus carpio TaxID=7962 RepID=A0A8C1KGS3_CYPCA